MTDREDILSREEEILSYAACFLVEERKEPNAMSCSIITEVHTLDDALFERVFKNEASDRIAATVAACLLQATNTTNCEKADEIRCLVADLCHDNEAGDDIIAMAHQIQELRNRKQAAKQPGYKGQ